MPAPIVANNTRRRARVYKFYAAAGVDIDLLAEGQLPSGDQRACAEIHFLGAGNFSVLREDDVTVTVTGAPAGYVFVGTAKKIFAVGTTATNILVYW